MSPLDIEQLCAEALKRINKHINRMAAQQLRRMRELWSKS